jgi:hypothetical protein
LQVVAQEPQSVRLREEPEVPLHRS